MSEYVGYFKAFLQDAGHALKIAQEVTIYLSRIADAQERTAQAQERIAEALDARGTR